MTYFIQHKLPLRIFKILGTNNIIHYYDDQRCDIFDRTILDFFLKVSHLPPMTLFFKGVGGDVDTLSDPIHMPINTWE